MYDSILDALRRGDAATALPAARDLAAERPTDVTAQRLLAAALRLSGDADGALAALDAALALEPEDAELHLQRAEALLSANELGAAQIALADSTALDPNQFSAYIVQAHLAILRGDLGEAERLVRTAARVAPDHPRLLALQGQLLLRRGDADRAIALLNAAARQLPDDALLHHLLGFAYLAKGHHAFAEQAFRRLLEQRPEWAALRVLVADLLRRQARPAEAADMLAPLLAEPEVPVAVKRIAGTYELLAGRHDRALPLLQEAFAEAPGDRRILVALTSAWQQLGLIDEARTTLEAALVEHRDIADLWYARLAFEPFAGPGARDIVERWLQAMPDCLPALEARVVILDAAGEQEAADAVNAHIVRVAPGHPQAEIRQVRTLLARDPSGAAEAAQAALDRTTDADARRGLSQLLGHARELGGGPEAAVAAWAGVHAQLALQQGALPELAPPVRTWPALGEQSAQAPETLLLWGAPGSLVERVATVCRLAGGVLLADRFGPAPPADPLQHPRAAQALVDGTLEPAAVVAAWRSQLPARGTTGAVLDWLPWWDNALLLALRPHLPEGVLLVALRDPRDMFVDWLSFVAPGLFSVPAIEAGARWLAAQLEQIAELHEAGLYPHRLLRLDAVANDPAAVADMVGQAIGVQLPPVPADAFGGVEVEPGRWRAFAGPLADAFALLTPVAQRLGYPAQ